MNEVLEKEDEGHSSDDDNSDESSEYEDYSGKILYKQNLINIYVCLISIIILFKLLTRKLVLDLNQFL